MWTLIHIALMATMMLAAGIFVPIFVVVESAEIAVTIANDLDKQLDKELTPKDQNGNS